MVDSDSIKYVLRHRTHIGSLAQAADIWSIPVFEPGIEIDRLPVTGQLCFPIYAEMAHMLSHNILLCQGLHLLLGYPPHLIPVFAYTGVELDECHNLSVSIYP